MELASLHYILFRSRVATTNIDTACLLENFCCFWQKKKKGRALYLAKRSAGQGCELFVAPSESDATKQESNASELQLKGPFHFHSFCFQRKNNHLFARKGKLPSGRNCLRFCPRREKWHMPAKRPRFVSHTEYLFHTVIFEVAFSTFWFKFGATLRRQAERSEAQGT